LNYIEKVKAENKGHVHIVLCIIC